MESYHVIERYANDYRLPDKSKQVSLICLLLRCCWCGLQMRRTVFFYERPQRVRDPAQSDLDPQRNWCLYRCCRWIWFNHIVASCTWWYWQWIQWDSLTHDTILRYSISVRSIQILPRKISRYASYFVGYSANFIGYSAKKRASFARIFWKDKRSRILYKVLLVHSMESWLIFRNWRFSSLVFLNGLDAFSAWPMSEFIDPNQFELDEIIRSIQNEETYLDSYKTWLLHKLTIAFSAAIIMASIWRVHHLMSGGVKTWKVEGRGEAVVKNGLQSPNKNVFSKQIESPAMQPLQLNTNGAWNKIAFHASLCMSNNSSMR